MASEIRMAGLDELHRQLRELPVTMERNVMRGALRVGAKIIADEAKRLVPVDSGALAQSIRVSMRVRSKAGWINARVIAGGRSSKKKVTPRGKNGVRIQYEDPWYAHLVEFGTARHYIKATTVKGLVLRQNKRASSGFAKRWTSWVVSGVEHPGARSKPFMRPAFDAKSQEAIEAVAEYIRNRLPRELRKVR